MMKLKSTRALLLTIYVFVMLFTLTFVGCNESEPNVPLDLDGTAWKGHYRDKSGTNVQFGIFFYDRECCRINWWDPLKQEMKSIENIYSISGSTIRFTEDFPFLFDWEFTVEATPKWLILKSLNGESSINLERNLNI